MNDLELIKVRPKKKPQRRLSEEQLYYLWDEHLAGKFTVNGQVVRPARESDLYNVIAKMLGFEGSK